LNRSEDKNENKVYENIGGDFKARENQKSNEHPQHGKRRSRKKTEPKLRRQHVIRFAIGTLRREVLKRRKTRHAKQRNENS